MYKCTAYKSSEEKLDSQEISNEGLQDKLNFIKQLNETAVPVRVSWISGSEK